MATEQRAPDTRMLAQQVDELANLTDALCQASRRTRWINRGLLLLLVIFLVVIVLNFYQLGKERFSEQYVTEVAQIGQQRFNDDRDKYLGHVERLANKCNPILMKAFNERISKDMPLYMHTADTERTTLANELRDKLTMRLHNLYEERLKAHQDMLMAAYPATKDEKVRERIMDNLQMALDHLLSKYYVDRFQVAVDGVFDAWDHFPVAPAPKKGDMSTSDQFMARLWQWLVMKISNNGPVVHS